MPRRATDPSQPAPVVLVMGEEELLAERAVAEAVRAATAALGPGTSVEEVRAGALPEGFTMGLATPSLFGGGRVTVILDAEQLDKAAREAVLALARDPHPGMALVLRAASAGRQARFFKELQQVAEVKLVPRLRPGERAAWLRQELRRQGRKADDRTIEALLATVGQDLRELAGAVAKLQVAVPPPAPITAEHVAEHLTPTAERGVFDLVDAVLARDAPAALNHLDALLAQGEQPVGLLALLARQLRLVLRVSELGGSDSQAAQAIGGGTRDWQVRRARQQARKFDHAALRRALALVAEADVGVRTGQPSRLVLELLVARLSGASAAPAGTR